MSWLKTAEIARMTGGSLTGADVEVTGVCTDSRQITPGCLFVALSGPRFDGHAFASRAVADGAAAVLAREPVDVDAPVIRVEDTRLALGRLAAAWRARMEELVLIGLTGSNGKTTVKEMIAAILQQRGNVLATPGNLNNDIGMPLTLLSLRPEHRFAVIEMGANHFGEIRYLARIANPDIGLVTNAGPAHLEGFGDLEGVAQAKGELFEELRPDATAIINADDRFEEYWRGCLHGQRLIRFGFGAEAEVRGEPRGAHLVVHWQGQQAEVRLAVPGRHNRTNALAAAAAALAAGATLEEVRQGLEAFRPVHGRLQPVSGVHGMRLIDDSYNANPASLGAAIEVLAEQPGERWLVLGDMGELGAEARAMHSAAGEAARTHGIERLFALGSLAEAAAEAFGEGAEVFESHEALAARLAEAAGPGVTALVKGSRSMAMDRVVKALAGPDERAASEGGHDHAA
ncbi:MAG: UDP-N-acetylmuramoyl-tripeptide--D-alanyl-D-alanine ligase [Gammaproteobacteria bacterium]|nr:MAG: UDP-N-acetylmuramoyl-tripeptide--D-alanyl-D-alanine ligase [Gammaproteobacteria bacterium]